GRRLRPPPACRLELARQRGQHRAAEGKVAEVILEGREACNDLPLDAESGDLVRDDLLASGTISRIVRRNASTVLRFGSSIPRRYSLRASADNPEASLESWLQRAVVRALNLRQPPARLFATICSSIAVSAGSLIVSPR